MAPKENEAKPLTREQLRMVGEFRKYRDIYKAAQKAGVGKNQALRVFHLTQFQEELDRQEEAVRAERARQQVKVEALTNDLIDKSLAELLVLDPNEQGALRLDAIRTALVVNGRIQSGTMRSLEVGAQRQNDDGDAVKQGSVYQAVFSVQGPVEAAPLMPEEPAAGPAAPVTKVTNVTKAASTPAPAARPAKPKAGALEIE